MGINPLNPAVFLDRDGVLNANVFNPATGEMESPHRPEDFRLLPGVIEAVRRLSQAGYRLFLVSNQPSYAKGKTSLKNIQAIAALLEGELARESIHFAEFYYCLHHPAGIVPEYSGSCDCRKPLPYFLLKAEHEHGILLADSWMVGDRETDVECGHAAGTRTIFVHPGIPGQTLPVSSADYTANDLANAVDIILATIS